MGKRRPMGQEKTARISTNVSIGLVSGQEGLLLPQSGDECPNHATLGALLGRASADFNH
jgi:hypothetical protein